MFICGDVIVYCDRCGQSYQVPGEQYMDEGVMCADHLCPDCAGIVELNAELVTLAEGEGAGEIMEVEEDVI